MSLGRIAAALALSLAISVSPAHPAAIGELMTSAQYRLLNGQKLTGDQLRGMVVVLTYWGEDCRACDAQLKLLDAYYRQRETMGLVAMVASADRITSAQFRTALRGYAIHGVSDVKGDLGPLEGIPTTYIIDRYGQLRFAHSGAMTLEELNAQLVPLLRQAQPKI